MLDVPRLLQRSLETTQEAPLWLILVWLGGTLFVFAQVVGEAIDVFEAQR